MWKSDEVYFSTDSTFQSLADEEINLKKLVIR